VWGRPDDTEVVNPDETELEAAQADGLACVYCGLSGREDGSLVPLRPSVRALARQSRALTQTPLGHSVTGAEASRCEPPCPDALLAYEESFFD
jgi:hypothetical protein